jgi:dTDP-4-dehydrorhamnose 3,5-epimerase-like enzyme
MYTMISKTIRQQEVELPKVTFVSRISMMGQQKMIITVPRGFWEDVEPLKQRKQVKVTVEEAYD